MYMEDFNIDPVVPKDWEQNRDKMIKVIGVGGGGCNAVSYMFRQKIEGCTFFVCNTDNQALEDSPVPNKIQIGNGGLGAGCDPSVGRTAAIEATDEIRRRVIEDETEMLFITAGMGGGTGTGAAPVIANLAKNAGILTVAVVTLPFENERNASLAKAIDGIRELENNVDSLLIINNQKRDENYDDLKIFDAFPKTDEILATAVRGIVDIIRSHGYLNVDFKDVKTMMTNSGLALMGTGTGRGENRIRDAVKGAMESPLLNDFRLDTAKNALINITSGKNNAGIAMKELSTINAMISEYTGNANNFKTGIVYDESEEYGDKVSITVIATGFEMEGISNIVDVNQGRIIVIDEDFVYDGVRHWNPENEEKKPSRFTKENKYEKIGFSDASNRRKFHYQEKPELIVSTREYKSDLENTAAIRRVK